MPSLHVEIEIDAPRRRVWQALIHKEQWMYWNTFLYDCNPRQPFVVGQEVSLSLRRVSGEEPTEFQPRITLLQPGVCLKWVSTIPGLMNEHSFELQDLGRDRTKYHHQENFSGVLTRLFLPFIRQDEHKGMRRMAWEFKHYVEHHQRR